MNKGAWKADWMTGLLVSVLVIGAGLLFDSFQGLELAAYDFGVRHNDATPSDDIAIIAIDDASIEKLGRWPWPRTLHARLIDRLREGGARVVATTVAFTEPQRDPGLTYIQDLLSQLRASSIVSIDDDIRTLDQRLRQADEANAGLGRKALPQIAELRQWFLASSLRNRLIPDINALARKLVAAEQALETDRQLARSIQQNGRVLMNMFVFTGNPRGNPDQDLPPYIKRNALTNIDDRIGAIDAGLLPPAIVEVLPPIPQLGSKANGIGYLGAVRDRDGSVRSDALVMHYYDDFLPSLSLLVAARRLNLSNDEIAVHLGEGIDLGGIHIDTDPALQLLTHFYHTAPGVQPFPVDSFYDVLEGNVPAERYKGKIVLVGETAAGITTPQVTPVSTAMPPVLVLAHQVSSLLNEDFFVRPQWALWTELAALLLIALYLILLLPRLKAALAALITFVLGLALFGTEFWLLASQSLWLQLMLPLALLLIGYVVLISKRFFSTEQGKLRSDFESAESNRMLGLAFQGQGQLDMAFDKFRKLELNDDVMELLYNLALDYERKRQFNKAHSVYRYMAEHDPEFKDIQQRLARSKKMDETVMLGSSKGEGTLVLSGDGVEKPMLGRYEVEKELGKGAMGVVYLGRDPKINRVVAIKTMALSQEFDESEIEEVKARFFREAETAGRLNHPNIVTIYDAGEEHDLAYIAMEFLKGKDLMRYTRPSNLLPPRTVMDIVARCADALAYAHGLNVVHRDVKPANVMYEPESGEIKITDFGIARITDSSKTKTGMVLGTPSYMSPEQLAGKKVDGRSDLFSLGVMFFQLLTGNLPFQAESMATLMYKIANEEHPDVTVLRPDLPPCVRDIVNRMLDKNVETRYQSGTDIARDIRACMDQLDDGAGS